MATTWLTYAWEDNKEGDVDFVAQELEQAGVSVKLDRWNLKAGKRLWEQIEHFIQDPQESDAWVLYATANSLGSEACKEEFAYALDRALRSRGQDFPVVGLFPGTVDEDLIPAGIRTRLYVSLTDPDWKERIKAAAEGRSAAIAQAPVQAYFLRVHEEPSGRYSIEVRPRAGSWSPFIAAIPLVEREKVNPSIMHGPAGRVPRGGMLVMSGRGESQDKRWWLMRAQNEATPTQSYYVHCNALPSALLFGVDGGSPQYRISLSQS